MTDNKKIIPIIAEEVVNERDNEIENVKLKKEVEELKQKLNALQVSNDDLHNKNKELEERCKQLQKGEWTSEEQKLIDILEATLPSFPNYITDNDFLDKEWEIERKWYDAMSKISYDSNQTDRVGYYSLMSGKAFYIFQRWMKSLKRKNTTDNNT